VFRTCIDTCGFLSLHIPFDQTFAGQSEHGRQISTFGQHEVDVLGHSVRSVGDGCLGTCTSAILWC
jgi:hypothetical protein